MRGNVEDDVVKCEVAILGTGLSASTLAAVLARHGVRVVMAEVRGPSPFPPGELGVHAATLFRVLAHRYEVPELAKLSSLKDVCAEVAPTSGAEGCHGFVYHRAGQPQRPEEVVQISPPKGAPPEPNFLRADVDAYLLRLAMAKGAVVYDRAPVTGVTFHPEGGEHGRVALSTDDGRRIVARYLVDASGPGSPLAATLGTGADPSRFTTRSRTLFTHVKGVRPFAEVVADAAAYRAPSPWSGGSMHHLFDGGYLCVIPFGNHEASTNDTASVVLTLDANRFPAPDDGTTAEAEFWKVVGRFPVLAEQLAGVQPVRDWSVSARNQYALDQTVGDGWCAIGDAAGYVDPFISRSLSTALETVGALAWRLLDAVRQDDFATVRFEPVARLTRRYLDANDRLAAMFLAGLRAPELVKSVLFVLEVGFRYGGFPTMIAYSKLRQTGSDAALRELEAAAYVGSILPTHAGFNEMFDAAGRECAAVAAGELDAATASKRIFGMVRDAEFVPAAFKLRDPSARFFRITPVTIARLALWSMRGAPPDIAPLIRAGIRSVLRGEG
ncbi:NAD(P)/FAD-dependent oxidoreductase [Phytohabitans suffuscus]